MFYYLLLLINRGDATNLLNNPATTSAFLSLFSNIIIQNLSLHDANVNSRLDYFMHLWVKIGKLEFGVFFILQTEFAKGIIVSLFWNLGSRQNKSMQTYFFNN